VVARLAHEHPVLAVAWSPDGSLLGDGRRRTPARTAVCASTISRARERLCMMHATRPSGVWAMAVDAESFNCGNLPPVATTVTHGSRQM
jgi:hypothetical protein